MNLSRRHILTAGLLGAVSLRLPVQAQSRTAAPLGQLGLDATQLGLRPGASEDQSQRLQTALGEAAKRSAPLLLPPGRYRIGKVEEMTGLDLANEPKDQLSCQLALEVARLRQLRVSAP